MVKISFNERWRQLLHVAHSKAPELGSSIAQIKQGNWREDVQVVPPGVVIYMSPGDELFSDTPYNNLATVRIFTIAGAGIESPADVDSTEDPVARSIGTAVEMAHILLHAYYAWQKANSLYIRVPVNPITLDTVHAEFSAALLQFVVTYRSNV